MFPRSTGTGIVSVWLTRREGRCRVVSLIVWLIAISLLEQSIPLITVAVFSMILSLFSGVKIRPSWLLVGILPIVLLLPWSIVQGETVWEWHGLSLTEGGLRFTGHFLLKTISMGLLVAMWLQSAPLSVHAMAIHRLGVPASWVALLTIAWRYVMLFRQEWERIRLALQVRGFAMKMNRHARHTMSHVMGSILVRSHHRGERVSTAMRCRGFRGDFCYVEPAPANWVDRTMVLASVVAATGLLAWDLSR